MLAMQSIRGAFDTQEERDILFLTLKWSAFMADKSTTQASQHRRCRRNHPRRRRSPGRSQLWNLIAVARARNFRISRLSLTASKAISNLAFACARNDSALPPTQLLFGLFS